MSYGRINAGITYELQRSLYGQHQDASPTIPHVLFDLNLRANQQLTWLNSTPILQKFKTTRL